MLFYIFWIQLYETFALLYFLDTTLWNKVLYVLKCVWAYQHNLLVLGFLQRGALWLLLQFLYYLFKLFISSCNSYNIIYFPGNFISIFKYFNIYLFIVVLFKSCGVCSYFLFFILCFSLHILFCLFSVLSKVCLLK